MFEIDNWTEIFHTIKKNKLRTFLTGFSVAWGIFMLIILLASGNGLRNGVMSNFGDRAVNGIEMWGRRTSMPYKGYPDSRNIELDQKDFDLIKSQMSEVEHISANVSSNVKISYETESNDCDFQGVYPVHTEINGVSIKDGQGRFINDIDMKERRKVVVINQRVKEVLFKNENPVGKIIMANGLGFKVIGVYKGSDWGNEVRGYIPFTTAQQLFKQGWGFGSLHFTVKGLKTKEDNELFEQNLRKELAALHQFDPKDERAIGIWNRLEDYLQTMGIFNGITWFVLFVGIGTLVAGIIGVGNIMLITVRERTKEFGIRKALGAKPSSILKLILMESIFITSIFGYVGMVMGITLSELVNSMMESAGGNEEMTIFKDPTVSIDIALGAVLILIISGVLAGYFPARRALKITAIEAMRAE